MNHRRNAYSISHLHQVSPVAASLLRSSTAVFDRAATMAEPGRMEDDTPAPALRYARQVVICRVSVLRYYEDRCWKARVGRY